MPQTFFEEMFLKVEKWGVSREVLTLLIDTQTEEAVLQGYDYTVLRKVWAG
ncbi:MAG: hypothetical protein HC775_14695 [Hyellaceae cyanobacterium CSU_1_1]|nr:hypothetical protein [Hyellaceae cyanobacterium CSU_1_1]